MSYQDPYTSTSKASQRLFKEWQKHPKLIVGVDFDDTFFDFHGTGNDHKRVIDVLKKCNQLGFHVVLWSASKPERFAFMQEYTRSLGIVIASINENPIPLPFGNDKKIYYNILLDDRAGLGQALDTLEIVIGMIENQPQYDSGDKQAEVLRPGCSNYLRTIGRAYPRTCGICKLGPCKYGQV